LIVTSSGFFGKLVFSILEGFLKTSLELGPLSVSSLLGFLSILGSLSLEGGLSGILRLLGSGGKELGLLLGEGVQFVHESLVGQSIGLGGLLGDGMLGFQVSKSSLNLIGVDDSGEISALHDSSVESVSLLLGGGIDEIAKDGVESGEGGFSVDNKSAEVTSRGELQNVESVDVANINTGDVSSGLGNVVIIIAINEEGTLSHDISRVSVFANTGSDFLGGSDLVEIIRDTELIEDLEEIGGLLLVEAIDNHGELSNILDRVSTGHNERSASGSSKGRGNSVSSLGDVALGMDLSPDLEGSKHTGLSSHVTEGSLTRSGSTGT